MKDFSIEEYRKVYLETKKQTKTLIDSLEEKPTEEELLKQEIYTAIVENDIIIYGLYNLIINRLEANEVDEVDKMKIMQAVDYIKYKVISLLAKHIQPNFMGGKVWKNKTKY